MRASVQLNPGTVKDSEDARAALVSACLPDVIDGVAGVVHINDCLLTVNLEVGLERLLPAGLPGRLGFALPHAGNLLRQGTDGGDDIADRGLGEEFSLCVYAIVNAHQTDLVCRHKVKESPEFANASQGVAELADHNGVIP